MIDLFEITGLIIISMLLGAMIFFSLIVAPITFIKLKKDEASNFIRSIFPWYYVVIIFLSLLSCAILLVAKSFESLIMGMISIGAIASRYWLIPKINLYRDRSLEGDNSSEKLFNRFHKFSVLINGLQILGIIYVLSTFISKQIH